VYILSDSSPRVLASQPWFLFRIEPDFHLLSQTGEFEQKIELVLSCQSRILRSVRTNSPPTSVIFGGFLSIHQFARRTAENSRTCAK
jgi:hypothetical protein